MHADGIAVLLTETDGNREGLRNAWSVLSNIPWLLIAQDTSVAASVGGCMLHMGMAHFIHLNKSPSLSILLHSTRPMSLHPSLFFSFQGGQNEEQLQRGDQEPLIVPEDVGQAAAQVGLMCWLYISESQLPDASSSC